MADIETVQTKRTTLYRMIDGTTVDTVFIPEKIEDPDRFRIDDVDLGGREARLVLGSSSSSAKWTSDVALLIGQPVDAASSSPGAALAIPDNHGSVWVLTWGTGFHYVDAERVDYAFGPGIVARSAIADSVKSVTKTVLDHRARVDRSSLPNGSTVRDLGVDGYGEVVSRIEAKAQIPGLSVGEGIISIRAAESLNLPLAKRADRLLADLDVLVGLTTKDVRPGLESVEQLIALKPRDQRAAGLEDKLLDEILSDDPKRLGLSWPHERLDLYGPVAGSKVLGFGDRTARVSGDVPELDEVLQWLREIPRSELRTRLDTIRVVLYSSPDLEPETRVSNDVPLWRWLAFEVREDEKRFCLHDGKWFRMDDRYLARIDERVEEILARDAPVKLPAWPADEDEREYNLRAAAEVGGLSLDRKLIQTPLHRGGIEPCDIFVPEGTLVHVKRRRSSADLSHLLAQGLVSTDALAGDESARAAWMKRIVEESDGGITHATVSRVVLAIGSSKPVMVDNLFTFTKVNLVKQYDALRALDVEVSVARIAEQ
ncbi:DUF6119 family protein [Curtobacterium sp. KBS0715]|uniref:DUF6119 family protein n=1 Tax=Curtobacterium sp. KBS0715 TaxID=1179671 RepID=UPI00163D7DC2|nr:DUF6119 family protein [Curtobacterium sp. KBS0715]